MRKVIVFLLLINISCSGIEESKEYKLDNGFVITLVKHRSSDLKSWTYIMEGKKTDDLDESICNRRNVGNNDWELLIAVSGDSIILYQPYHYFSLSDRESERVFMKNMVDTVFYSIYNKNKKDEFLRLSSDDL